MIPRDYKPMGGVLSHDALVVLKTHPEAFDCIVFPAKPSEYDEVIAENRPVGTLLDSDERAQEYEAPVQARAMLVPKQELDFDSTESGNCEGFTHSYDAIYLIVSLPGLRRFSLIQWLEYISVEQEETIERTVYVQDVRPMGRTLTADMVYVCYPLPAMGEVPDIPEAPAAEGESGNEGGDSAEGGAEGDSVVGVL